MDKTYKLNNAAGSLDAFQEQIDYLNLAKKFNFEFIWGELSALNRKNKLQNLMGFLKVKHLFLEDKIAKIFYVNFYFHH